MYFGGVDIGASAAKVALVNQAGKLLGHSVRRSGVDFAASARKGLAEALTRAGLAREEVRAVFACGYGRGNVEFADATPTEIACHAAGAYFHFPRAITVVDIGGQDNKVIRLDERGNRVSFQMNRKCAAGTGAFLEEMALRLDLELTSFDRLAREAAEEVSLGSFCTVFTATEVLAKIRHGVPVGNLVRGLFGSVLKRIREMDPLAGEVVMTGGVVEHSPYLAEMLAAQLGRPVLTPPHPQLTGAWGAALLARRSVNAGTAPAD
ncbi:MAG: ATPase [Deltaproteobacteria bacterium]|nr:ATPase [Deltaproteobacteria bacterium]